MHKKHRITNQGWFCMVALGAVILLAACGNYTTTGATATPTSTPNTSTSSSTPPTKGYGYGSGGGTTPTATAAISGLTMTVTITTDSGGTFAFNPVTLTIPVGTTVIWKNTTAAPHTVTSDDGKTFDSGVNTPISAQGGTFSFKFTSSGKFTYHCEIHPYMTGTIIVT
jgi:plastocyanin